MPKITFTKDYKPKYGDAPSFKRGDVKEMSDDSCKHYVSRGVAVHGDKLPDNEETETAENQESEKPKPKKKTK